MPRLRNLHKLLDPEIRAKNLRALHWELRGLWWDVTRPEVPDPVFVIGCSRSGTTITYETLAASPRFASFGRPDSSSPFSRLKRISRERSMTSAGMPARRATWMP